MSCKKHPSAFDSEQPYSSILEVECSRLIIISGQVAEDEEDNTVGTTIEEQAEQTLKNCQALLSKAGCTLDDVFKVNVFIRNIEDWARFNTIYKKFFSQEPKPVRTTVQAGLLSDFLVEIELWAAKK